MSRGTHRFEPHPQVSPWMWLVSVASLAAVAGACSRATPPSTPAAANSTTAGAAAAGREDSPANGTSARVSPADERLVSRVFRVFVSQPQKTLPRMSGYLPQSGIFLPSARRLSEFGRLAALV